MFPFVLLGAAGIYVAYTVWREAHFHWVVKDIHTVADTEKYKVRIEPDFQDRILKKVPNGIRIIVENKTDDELIIDWANTLYVANGNTDGNFIFDGKQVATQISGPRAPDVIWPHRWSTKVIKPASQVKEHYIPSFSQYSSPTKYWSAPDLKSGEHGVYLTLRHNGETAKETLLFSLNHERNDVAQTELPNG